MKRCQDCGSENVVLTFLRPTLLRYDEYGRWRAVKSQEVNLCRSCKEKRELFWKTKRQDDLKKIINE